MHKGWRRWYAVSIVLILACGCGTFAPGPTPTRKPTAAFRADPAPAAPIGLAAGLWGFPRQNAPAPVLSRSFGTRSAVYRVPANRGSLASGIVGLA